MKILPASLRPFKSQRDYDNYRAIYDRSLTLQRLPEVVLQDPVELMETLEAHLDQLNLEVGQSRGGKAYSLVSFTLALIAGGRIPSRKHLYVRTAAGRKLFSRSRILQSIPADAFTSPEETIARLEELRPAIVEEQRTVRNLPEGRLSNYALSTLYQTLIAGGRIGHKPSQIIRSVGLRDLYNRSPILQGISEEVLSSPKILLDELARLRPAIIEEQRATRNLSDEQLSDYALSTLACALLSSGKIAKHNHQDYTRMAGNRDLYDRSPILQAISDDDLETPERLIDVLIELRPAIVEEQRKEQGLSPDAPITYALSTLIAALNAGGRISHNLHTLQRYAVARDNFEKSQILQGIDKGSLSDPCTLVKRLAELRDEISEELWQHQASNTSTSIRHKLGDLVFALESGGKLPRGQQDYHRHATGYELYQRSSLLQSLPDEAMTTPQHLLKKLVELKPKIIEEQRQVRGVSQEDLRDYSLETLVVALEAAGRIVGLRKAHQRFFGSYDIYDRSPTLGSISPEEANNPEALMRFLITFRDRIALEVHHATERIGTSQFIFPKAEEYYALTTLMVSLYSAAIVSKKYFDHVHRWAAGPLEYFMKRRPIIESLIIGDDYAKHRAQSIDRSIFTALDDPSHLLSDIYVTRIIRWGRWFLDDHDVAVRSIYHADELAFMALMSFRSQIEYISKDASQRLERAGHRTKDEPTQARRDAVIALNDMLAEYNNRSKAGASFDGATYFAMRQINRLVRWNYDALPGGANALITGMYLSLPSSPAAGTI